MESNEDVERLLCQKYPGLAAELQPSGACIIRGVLGSEVSYPYFNFSRQTNNDCIIKDTWRRLKLYLPHHPALHGFQLYVQESLEYKLYTSANLKLQDDWLLEDFLDHLPKILPAQKPQQCQRNYVGRGTYITISWPCTSQTSTACKWTRPVP